jgi:hypothetical protein
MKIPSLLLLATVALAPLSAVADELLVKFDGGIGVDPVSTATTPNIVRGVQPPGLAWAIADLKAEVMVDGRIKADGRGLVFAGGNTIGTALAVTPTGGTTASLKVFATLICENVPTFVQRNTNLAGVPLAANGDFTIDDVLSPPPPRSSCATPVLLIRSTTGGLNWFAAGIQKFDDNH